MMILLPFAALLAIPAEPHPTGSWQVSEEERGCQVTRSFAGDAEIDFGFETYLTGTGITMLVAAPREMLPVTGPGEIRVAVSPTAPMNLHFGLFNVADPKFRLLKLFPDKTQLGTIAGAEMVEIGSTPIRVPLKGVGGALTALRGCTEGLLTKWGVDPKRWRDDKLAGYAGKPGTWMTDDDADKILPRGVSRGTITALVTTTIDGAPATCKAIASSDPRIDKPICDLIMRRTRYRAPLGDDSKPMESYAIVPFTMNR